MIQFSFSCNISSPPLSLLLFNLLFSLPHNRQADEFKFRYEFKFKFEIDISSNDDDSNDKSDNNNNKSDSDINDRRDRDGDSDLSRMGRAEERKISINMLMNIEYRVREKKRNGIENKFKFELSSEEDNRLFMEHYCREN